MFNFDFKGRLARLRKLMNDNGLDVFILFVLEGFNTENCYYISGFRGSSAALVITQSEALLITDGRYKTQSKQQARDFEIIIQSELPLASYVIKHIRDNYNNNNLINIGLEYDKISHRLFNTAFNNNNNLKFHDAGDLIKSLRRTKDAEEVRAIREAARIARAAYGRVLESVHAGMTENEFSIKLFSEIKLMGAEGGWPGHDFIVASGLNGAMCHARATSKKFEKYDVVTVDYGATVSGYMSDITRNFAISGVTPEAERINDILLRAHHEAAAALRPGISGRDVDAVARKIIADAGYGDYFMHGLGHGLGLEIHEAPRLSHSADLNNNILQVGDVVTVEPGIYIENAMGMRAMGMRIEDDYLITEDGAECLTERDNQALELIN